MNLHRDPIQAYVAGGGIFDIATPQIAQKIINGWFPHDDTAILKGSQIPFCGRIEQKYDPSKSEYVTEIRVYESKMSFVRTALSLIVPDLLGSLAKFTIRTGQQPDGTIYIRYIWTGHEAGLNDSKSNEFKILHYLINRTEEEFAFRGYHKLSSLGRASASSDGGPLDNEAALKAQRTRAQAQATKLWWRNYVAGEHGSIRDYNFWPTPQDFLEAVQNPASNFRDDDLRNSEAALTALGIPRVASGMFASVYQFSPTQAPNDSKDEHTHFAVRCFNTKLSDQHERYRAISKFILADDLTYTVDFNYLEDGIKVNGTWFPVLKMNWVEGATLDAYVGRNLRNPEKLETLRANFRKMMVQLAANGIAHGDLQHGNILISQDEIYLVDYDGFYVPELQGRISNELGHTNYQHPKRVSQHFGPYLDNFAAWVIDLTLQILIADPAFWDTFEGGDECLIFRRNDFARPESSTLFKALKRNRNPLIHEAGEQLLQLLQIADLEKIPYLTTKNSEQNEPTGREIPS